MLVQVAGIIVHNDEQYDRSHQLLDYQTDKQDKPTCVKTLLEHHRFV